MTISPKKNQASPIDSTLSLDPGSTAPPTCTYTHLDLIGERSRGVAAGDGGSADVPRGLEDGALAVLARGDDVDVGGVLDGGDGPGCEQQLLPRLVHVDDVDAVVAALVDVLHHGRLRVFGPDVSHGSQHLGDVGLLRDDSQVKNMFPDTVRSGSATYLGLQDIKTSGHF